MLPMYNGGGLGDLLDAAGNLSPSQFRQLVHGLVHAAALAAFAPRSNAVGGQITNLSTYSRKHTGWFTDTTYELSTSISYRDRDLVTLRRLELENRLEELRLQLENGRAPRMMLPPGY